MDETEMSMNVDEFLKRLKEMTVEWNSFEKESNNATYAYGFNSGIEKAARELEEEIDEFKAALEELTNMSSE